MSSTVKTIKLVRLIEREKRVSMRRAIAETGIPERTIYRKIAEINREFPARIENGVIFMEGEK